MQLFERNTLDEIVAFDLLRADPRPELPGFGLVEQADLFEICMNQARLEVKRGQDAAQGLSLTGLLRARHAVAQAATGRIDALLVQARKRGFEQLTLAGAPAAGGDAWAMGLSPDWTFRYTPGQYPARQPYAGRWRFARHYFADIHALKSQGEEFECARALDALPELRHWVRNIEQQESFSFWLPTASDYFYPDFVAELNDGRLLVVEYKGDGYATNDDSREKRAVGAAWARASGGRGLFVMVERVLDGMDMAAQLRRAIGAP